MASKKTDERYSHKALVVGIDKYQIAGADLSGCVNDAKDMVQTLIQLGFPKSQIHLITNERATKERILKEYAWLAANTGPGDVRIKYQSSHGSNKRDTNRDEPDGRDEMLIMHNFDWADESTHLTDDDIRENLVKKVHKEARLDVILDTCHSGTGTRSLFTRVNPTAKPRFLSNTDEFHILNGTLPIRENRKWFGNSVVDRELAGDSTENNGLIYGCMDFQYSYETAILVNGVYLVRGVMTFNLCNILRETRGNITREELGQQLRLRVADQADQTPGYECSNDKFYRQYPFRSPKKDEPGEVT